MPVPKTLQELLAGAEARLDACGVSPARLEAEVMMAYAMGIDRGRLAVLLAGRAQASVPVASLFRRMVRRRCLREPLAYVTGHREFWSLDLEVGRGVLIPRPETEILVRDALSVLPAAGAARSPLVADIGTGSGAVAIALAKERPAATVVATDVSPVALEVASRNVRRHGLTARVRLVGADLMDAFAFAGEATVRRSAWGGFDLIVTNPPYVALEERETLMPEVREWEPPEALYAGPGGMEIIERLVPQASRALAPGGWLMMEVAAPRAQDVVRLLEAARVWQDLGVREDHAGLPRVVRSRLATGAAGR